MTDFSMIYTNVLEIKCCKSRNVFSINDNLGNFVFLVDAVE